MSKTPASVRVSTFGTLTIPLGRSDHNFSIDTTKFSPEVLDHVFAYGLRQIINDAAASGKTPDEKLGLANKRLETLYSGELRAARQGGSPLAKAARDIALDLGKRKGHTGDALKAFVEKAAKADAVLHLAQKRVDEAKAFDIDLSLD